MRYPRHATGRHANPTASGSHGLERRGQVYVGLAAVAWSTTGLLQRNLSVDAATQVAGRAFFAAIALLLYVAVAERGRLLATFRSIGPAGLGLAACLTVATSTFVAALNHTTVARVLLIQAIAPVIAALLARVLLGEPISRRTAAAMAVALAGVAIMLGAPGGGTRLGDGLALVMTLAFAVALVIARYRREVSMAPAACLAQVMLLPVFVPLASVSAVGPAGDLPALVLLGAQVGIGLVLLTLGAQLISTAQVGLITLLEVVLGPLWVYLAYNEGADLGTVVGGALVIGAIVVQTMAAPAREDPVPQALPPH